MARAQTNSNPNSSGLIAWWKLNEESGTTALDSSGNNYQGTINGATWSSTQGISALNFDGVSNYVALPSLPVANVNSLTVVAWINPNLAQSGYIFYSGSPGEVLLHNGERYSDGPVDGSNPTLASFSVKIAGYTWYDVYSSTPMQPNTWYQLVGVWTSGASLKIYVDGAIEGNDVSIPSGNLNDPGSSFSPSIGIYSQNEWGSPNGAFEGKISNVMLYNRALSDSEIQTLYADQLSTVAPTPTPSPTASPSPSPTPTIPEFPSFAIIVLITVVGSTSLLTMKRKLHR